jgi:hypothetical protein
MFRGEPPKDAYAATMTRLFENIGLDEKKRPSPDKFEKVTSKDKVPGRLWMSEVPWDVWVGQPPEIVFAALASFEKDGVEYGLFLRCAKQDGKKYKRDFEAIAKSFKFFDDKAEDVEALDVLDGVNITPRRRREIERGKIKGWNVIVSPKKQYVVIYNTKNGKNHALAQTIAERIEKIREQVYEVQFPPAKPIQAVSVVRVCADAKDYSDYGGPGGSAGYWSSGSEELVFYDMSASKKIDDDTVGVLYHEAFHQFIYYSVGDVAPHSWFNEGHGDYYAGARYRNGKFTIEKFDWRVGTVQGAIVEGPRPRKTKIDPKGNPVLDEEGNPVREWGNKGYTPLCDLVRFSQGEYYSYPGVSYAQGWSLIYFLREIVPKNKKWNEKWGKILSTYFDTLKREVNSEEGFRPMGTDPVPPDDGGDEPDEPEPDDPTPEPPADPGEGTDPSDPPPDGPGDPSDPSGEPDEPTPPPLPPPPPTGRFGSRAALEKALEAAFAGIDWEEFEAAWLKETK